MSHLRPVARPACAHCGGPVPAGGADGFCCAGCAGAHALVAGLGLDAFYRRRDPALAAAALRPAAAAPDVGFAVRAARPEDPAGTVHALDLLVPGLACGACVWLLEEALAAEPDVLRARASLADRRLRLVWRGPRERAAALAALPARLGFGVAPWSAACLRAAEDAEGRALLLALGVAAFGAANVMLLSVALWFGGGMGEGTRWWLHAVTAAIALPVVAVAGLPFYRSALAGLRAGRATMDLAVSLGVLAATAMSVSEALRNGPYTWFDGATSLLALLLAGRVLDRAARRRALGAVSGLLALAEGEVTLLDPDGIARAVPAADVRPGSRVLVAPGERLRLDGVLEAAEAGSAAPEALLDLSAVTGEAMPRPAAAGDALPAGAVNLGAGALVVRVSAAAADGSLAALARLVRRAEAERGRLGDLADRAAAFYVPAVHAVAAGTFLLWWQLLDAGWRDALVPAVAVLIVTCPCGLAIAVPAVRAVATGVLFRRGVLVASGGALERLAEVDHAVLDKTGTLTEGRPALLPDPARPAGALAAAAALARSSRHPLARALAEACPDAPAAPEVEEVPGAGLRAAGGALLGSAAFVGVPAPDPEGASGPVLWWRAGPGAAPVAFRFMDRPRPDAAAAVAALRRLGLSVEILSGDAPGAVSAVAAAVGGAEWRAGVSPAGKAARMEALRASGRRALMVGDGINDAAAMALAHASVSPGGATDLAQDAADLVLRDAEGGGLLPLAGAVALARRARRIARGSLGFSLAYNLVAVPAAVAGLVTPLLAAVVMATSSLVVTGNALRVGR